MPGKDGEAAAPAKGSWEVHIQILNLIFHYSAGLHFPVFLQSGCEGLFFHLQVLSKHPKIWPQGLAVVFTALLWC